MNLTESSSTAEQLAVARRGLSGAFEEVRTQLKDASPLFTNENIPDYVAEAIDQEPTELDLTGLIEREETSFLEGKLFMRLVETRLDGTTLITCRCLAGMVMPPHYHSMDEMILVRAGMLKDLHRGLSYHRGESLYFPAGVVHTPYTEVDTEIELIFSPPRC